MTIGWKVHEVIGQVHVNPMIYVYDTIRKNKEKQTVTEDNIGELVKLCFSFVPHRKARVLDVIIEEFPELADKINTYRILV